MDGYCAKTDLDIKLVRGLFPWTNRENIFKKQNHKNDLIDVRNRPYLRNISTISHINTPESSVITQNMS